MEWRLILLFAPVHIWTRAPGSALLVTPACRGQATEIRGFTPVDFAFVDRWSPPTLYSEASREEDAGLVMMWNDPPSHRLPPASMSWATPAGTTCRQEDTALSPVSLHSSARSMTVLFRLFTSSLNATIPALSP